MPVNPPSRTPSDPTFPNHVPDDCLVQHFQEHIWESSPHYKIMQGGIQNTLTLYSKIPTPLPLPLETSSQPC